MPLSCSVLYTRRRSRRSHWRFRLFTTNGLCSFAYASAFARGNPSLNQESRASTFGHSSTGSRRMRSSPKTRISNSPNFSRRVRMALIAFDLAFFSMAHTPTMILRFVTGISAGRGKEARARGKTNRNNPI
jgi:hypothetical protein